MDKAGDLLSFFFDKNFSDKADRYSGLFKGWEDLVGTDLAHHCRIVDIRNHVVEIDVDHPGWKQRFQFKQRTIIERLKKAYPELEIRTVRVMVRSVRPSVPRRGNVEPAAVELPPEAPKAEVSLESIDDDDFKASLARLGKAIDEKNRP